MENVTRNDQMKELIVRTFIFESATVPAAIV